MSERVRIDLDREDLNYLPGEELIVDCWVDDPYGDVRDLDVTVEWYTEGKGTTNKAVHYEERLPYDPRDPRDGVRFRVPLPNSPLTYDGVLIRILWCVRIKTVGPRGKGWTGQRHFALGTVPQARRTNV
jgi:hypothetical protein